MNDLLLATRLLEIAQLSAPFDSGNLGFKSITIDKTPTGYRLTSWGHIASYNLAVETGPLKRRPSSKEANNIGWWTNKVAGNTSRYIDGFYNGNFNRENVSYKDLVEKSKDFPAQNERFLKEISR